MENVNLILQRAQHGLDDLKCLPLSSPDLDDAFYVFALRVTSEDSVGKRKLTANKFYYFLDGFAIYEDRILVSKYRYQKTIYDYYFNRSSDPHLSISAIVGENGAGKSSLLEFELRLINNFSAVLFGEYPREVGKSHLHFIEGVSGELYYVLKQNVYCLSIQGREVNLYCYYWQSEEESNQYVFKHSGLPTDIIGRKTHSPSGKPIRSVYSDSYFESLKKILPRFFYTVVLNTSVFAYNTNDFKTECNTDEYEAMVRRGSLKKDPIKVIPYSTDEKCWLGGLFHKNDGYQIPLVLMPCRKEGNYDINTENRLAYERLISVMVRNNDSDRIINSHLKVISFDLHLKAEVYDLKLLHEKVGFKQFSSKDFQRMKELLLKTWSDKIDYKILDNSHACANRELAVNYMVYKTLKIANTYDEYREFRYKYNIKGLDFDEDDFINLVKQTLINNSHITRKLFRTIAYLIWNIYDMHGDTNQAQTTIFVDGIGNRWIHAYRQKLVDWHNPLVSTLLLEATVPPPFFETTIDLEDVKTGAKVPFEYLSSGEKQQAFSTSLLVYHLKNIDSISADRSTEDRVAYENVQLILEEVELYYHPELQRQFVLNLMDGIRQAGLTHIKWINVCIVTHSPFVLSDIPANNVLALKKDDSSLGKIPSFAANIHDMLKMSFFLDQGSVGSFASWTTTRIAKCLRIVRWMNGSETAPNFFKLKKDFPDEYKFLEDFLPIEGLQSTFEEKFNMVYSSEIILAQINMIEEPIVRHILLDDYKRTFKDYVDEYKHSMRNLLQSQLDALNE